MFFLICQGHIRSDSSYVLGQNSNSLSVALATFYIEGSSTINDPSESGDTDGGATGISDSQKGIGIQFFGSAMGPTSSTYDREVDTTFDLMGSYSGPQSSLPTNISYSAQLIDLAFADVTLDLAGSSGTSKANSSFIQASASLSTTGYDSDAPSPVTTTSSAGIANGLWAGQDGSNTLDLPLTSLSDNKKVDCLLNHPVSARKDDTSYAIVQFWFKLLSVSQSD